MSYPLETFLKNLSSNEYYTETLRPRWLDQPGMKVDALDNLLYHEAIYRIKKSTTKRNVLIDDLEYFYRVHLITVLKDEDLSGLKNFCGAVVGWILEETQKVKIDYFP